jgi:hypothetical protein
MDSVTPIMRVENTRETVYGATDELFERFGVGYQSSRLDSFSRRIIDLLTEPARSKFVSENLRAIHEAIEINLQIKNAARQRTVGRKVLDFFAGRNIEERASAVRPTPNISYDECALYERTLEGQVRFGGSLNLEPFAARIVEYYLDGTLAIDNEEFNLDPDDRLVNVDLRIPKSDHIKYDSLVTYTLYPGNDSIQVEKNYKSNIRETNDSQPFHPIQPNLYQLNMVFAINAFEQN